ncbi:LysR family transcriptional regulator [Allopusillimonas soli]|uniref:LysR family transcriptional regulator n=1 Tax=Allopusillimonas soli TaxID=659016 RepID=A0A853FLP2_9BURK|nr:LysR family transcriptional regulator [Allopusillimonas soli]NYT38816.1 LysR family transcriptional regulator [Allopusillimonas soli]TEA70208.1 LysR family transcriptional regulator [Allopusillimonas soli]
MNIEYLESFTKVVACKSLAEAARRLHITAGAVAARIRILESELGMPLVQRSGHSVTPTEAGMRIYQRAQDLIRDARDLQAVASTGSLEGELQLGVFPSALTTHLPALLDAFCTQHYPDLSIKVEFDVSMELCRKVHEGQLDLAIAIEPPYTINKNCGWHTLQEETLIVIAPTSHAKREPHDLLARAPFIRYDRRAYSGKLVDRYLKDNHILPRQRIEIDSLLTIVALVERGVGVSLVPDSFSIWYQTHAIAKLALPHRTPVRRIGIVWNRQGPRVALAEALIDHADTVFKPAASNFLTP